MKNMLFLFLFYGCSQTNEINGIYVRPVESEYSKGEDSLLVSQKNGQLIIQRHTGYQRIKHGQLVARQVKLQHSVFKKAGNAWHDSKTGVLLTFQAQTILLGSAVYQKVK